MRKTSRRKRSKTPCLGKVASGAMTFRSAGLSSGLTRCRQSVYGLVVVLLLLCDFSLSEEPGQIELSLVPYPQQIEIQEGIFLPKEKILLTYEEEQESIDQIARTCIQDLADVGFSVVDGKNNSTAQASIVRLTLQDDHSLAEEGYRLKIDSKVTITAATEDGLFWGTRTLLQLFEHGPEKAVPQLSIMDYPAFGYRGLLIDNARHFHTLSFHIATIKRLASLKMNRYQIHFSDHQSYTLPSTAFPNLPTPDRHYTVEQIEQLVAAAQRYHVMIVPEIDVPGHSKALCSALRQFACSTIPANEIPRKLCIGKESTYELLETLFTEVMEMIPGAYWHLGADEVQYERTRCADCRARMKEEGFRKGYELYHYFINRMHGIVKKNGRQMFVWEGFDPTRTPRIDKDIVVFPFDVYHEKHMPKDYFKAGYTLLNTAWTPLYVADYIYMTTPEMIARWTPFMFGPGRSPRAFTYWKKFDPETYKDKIMGAQVCSWNNEEKAENGLLFGTGPGFHNYGRPAPRVQIVAERVWTGSSTPSKLLLERVGASYWKH
ncbi:MAG: beta-N-acetylhexosaminidase [Candidatus Hydrogenedentes bacterium]|nr:beta-N-acetylhexosaminidase [Candidatus Hydrogenedentota bacterium]